MKNRSVYIFKNTAFLYVRMFISIVIGFYTTRVVLDVLGLADYGIYTLVGGLVVLFNFLNDALLGTVKRYVSVGIGRNDIEYTRKVFNVGLLANLVIGIVIVILLETIVYWYLINKLNIPDESINSAKIVFHLSTLRVLFGILQVPYSSLIIAHEKMGFFALTSIVDTLSKLVIVIVLKFIPQNKLILYALLLFLASVPMLFWHIHYCRKHFGEILKYKFIREKSLYKEIFSFSLWSMVGGVSAVANKQGANIILNLFFGVIINATMGIVNQVSAIIGQLASAIQTAFGPPLTKSYAAREFSYMRGLLSRSCRCSVFMILLVTIPVIINLDYLLFLWLGNNVPPQTSSFIKIFFITLIIESFGAPLYQVIASTGDIKRYQIFSNLILLSVLPLGYFLLRLGLNAKAMLCSMTLGTFGVLVYRIYYVFALKLIDGKFIVKDLLLPIGLVIIVSLLSLLMISFLIDSNSILMVLLSSLFEISIFLISVYVFGITENERQYLGLMFKKKVLGFNK